MTDRTHPIEVVESRSSTVGGQQVRRALPQRHRRTVSAWCFADHIGPPAPDAGPSGIGPHPHIGLQTVTWVVAGELLHRDSLATEQPIRPGQLNLMTAGHGISHAEEPTRPDMGLHGIQLCVAQPERTRRDPPAFEHYAELPHTDVATGTARVLVGSLAGVTADARRDTEHFGAELMLDVGSGSVPVRHPDEHAIIVLEGAISVSGAPITPGKLAYLEPGRDEIPIHTHTRSRVILLGGEPFEAPVTMWWNYVARSNAEIDDANVAWAAGDDRFGETGSTMNRIPAPRPPWNTGR